MKKLVKMLIIVVTIAVFTLPVAAEENVDKHLSDFENILPEHLSGITEDEEKLISSVGIDALLHDVISALCEGGGALAFFAVLIGGVAISAVADRCHVRHTEDASRAVGILLSAVTLTTVVPLFDGVLSGLSEATDFFAACVPIMAAVGVAGGGIAGAGVQAVGMDLTIAILSRVLLPIFTALISFSLALGALSPLGDPSSESVMGSARSFFLWLLGIVTALIMGALSLQTVVAAAGDSARMRAAKYVASGMIPVVGGTVAGSMATLASGLSYVKGIIGAGAVAVLISIFLSPLVMLLLYRLALTVASSLADFLGVSAPARIYKVFARAFDLVIAVYTTSVVLYIFEVVLFCASGVAVA